MLLDNIPGNSIGVHLLKTSSATGLLSCCPSPSSTIEKNAPRFIVRCLLGWMRAGRDLGGDLTHLWRWSEVHPRHTRSSTLVKEVLCHLTLVNFESVHPCSRVRMLTSARGMDGMVKIGQNLSKVVKSSLRAVLVKMVKTLARRAQNVF